MLFFYCSGSGDLPVSDVTLVKEQAGSGRVTGILTNTSGRKLRSVVVQFAILDGEGTQIATAQDVAMGVAQEGKWRFAAPYITTTGKVASATLGNIMAVPEQSKGVC
ncbi:FxLYD domain-containing protein [Burkholderia cepacia]|uniref:FxLYD domain-containing protein n=1 Tax=Burkholderia cepacia TaxID=292 RepID=UPI001C936CFF|nr:FxLYD domain-containing protein [Burkholderia cepacia]MBY4715495.1 FxLYD domain-containing protein [Burkholderia cepacia]MBY4741452.1 FxLYD domain-containing protein [Burkholderia cepacia]MBY4748958.1 FxLYD domain-containing protein [Burkholderia cepacia]MBY4758784.1 FxLYD domain-containing protein [Burkholderia cepacia]MBY4779137.1 FxLYD domain-containing protein [Burkholderia cepacia]